MTDTETDGSLLVPLANPETADRLLDSAIDIARARSMRIVVLHVVEVPPQLPLSDGDSLLDDDGAEKRLLEDAVDRIGDAGVAVDSRIRYARDVATGIVGAVDDHDAETLLAGWRGRPRRRDIVLGSFLDRILGGAPCDVIVKRIRRVSRDIDSILVPVSEGPHAELAVDTAGRIASERNASVRLLYVIDSDASDSAEAEAETLLADRASRLEGSAVDVESSVLQSDHVAGAITDETAHHDLTVLGATRDPFLRRKLVGSVAEGVGRSASSSVMLARKAETEAKR